MVMLTLNIQLYYGNGDVKHPTLLHNELYFTELVVWSARKRVLHGSGNNTLSSNTL